VALCAARGQALLVALLGIVKSGAAYLPLDPQYPAARLRLMVDDARPALTLHDDSIGAEVLSVFAQAGLETLHLADDAPDFRHRPAYDPQPHGSGGDLAYVMYTSGSTGRPKGVMVNHRAVARLVLDTDYVELGADDAVAQVASVSFDAATFEIWGAWLNGARLVVLPPDVALSTPRLGAAIREHSITTMFLTTALFNAHAAGDPAIFAPLRTLVFGGEAADPVSITRVLESGAAPARLVNGYGPTETTTFATTWRVPADPAAHAGETTLGVPIGRPIANTSCHVLDASGRPQPIGVAGELHVGGPGVARGYLGREDLNAERFVADPFEPDGGMLYRTGDLVRWRDDGTLLYVGRNDQQVKIRGFRIELGEVEKALRDCTGVREAAVVADDHPRIGKRLVGFVIPTHECDTAAWRAELRARLPEYMVPALLEEIDVLPITANGKLDRTVLIAHLRNRTSGATAIDPSARRSTSRGGDSLARPLDETTTRLLAIWRRILDRPSLDADAHFFEVGGHSLLALRMLAEVEREFGIELRVAALFEVPTARLFAGLLRDRPASAGTGCAVTIQGGGPTAPLFFVSGYGGEIVMFRDLARALGPTQPLVVLDTAAFRAEELAGLALPDVAARMIADLRAIQPRGPYHLCGYSLGGKFVYEIARQLRESGEEVALLALLDCNAPGYPKRRPLRQRLAVHASRIFRQGVAENARYLRGQFGWFARRFRERDLFEHLPELADSRVAQSMSASAEAMFEIWREHQPTRYEGSLLVVRAALRTERASVIDDDPRLGWAAWVDGPITVRNVPADHLSMLRPAHSDALAATLADFLDNPKRRPTETHQVTDAAGQAVAPDQAAAADQIVA
ncbi:MAG: amino acid adenylation domain-containing protein, partial [Pseudomonadota bacterium]|nr:amino acid adenylation domain-containing protein [Pseudomonadota bacterium]